MIFRILIFLMIFGLSVPSFCQKNIGYSPYSAFGLGEFLPMGFARNQGMGGLHTALTGPEYHHTGNPASLAFTRYTNLETGLSAQTRTFGQNGLSQQVKGGGLAYLAFSFPIIKNVASLALAYQPFSSADYSVTRLSTIPGSSEQVRQVLSGNGGLSRASITLGVRLIRGLSLGLQTSYQTGNITREQTYVFLQNNDVPVASRQSIVRHSNFILRPGLLWQHKLDTVRGTYINAGVFCEPGRSGRVSQSVLSQLRGSITRDVNVILEDTLGYDQMQDWKWPISGSAGIHFGRFNHWNAGFELSAAQWSKLQTPDAPAALKDNLRFAAGGEWTPAYDKAGYYNRVTYRMGMAWERSPYSYNGQAIQDQSLSLGFSLPVSYKDNVFAIPLFSFGFSAGRRGYNLPGAITENYFRATLGITLNERAWFAKYKID